MVKLQEEVAEKGGFKRLDGGRCGCAVPAAA
jgi:hypothetical protein